VDALTQASLSPATLGGAQRRLARTHPSLSVDLAEQITAPPTPAQPPRDT
jgi:hypothetical protein